MQSIKRPVLLELWGPFFMSNGATSNLQYRLKEVDGGTLITFRHSLVGPPPGDDHARMGSGWAAMHARSRRGGSAAATEEEPSCGSSTRLIGELEQEARTTARVLERVPEAHLAWKPHPKSFSLGQLALHVASVPGNVAALAARDTAESPGFTQSEAASTSELVPALEASVARAREHLGGFDDAAMTATWRLIAGGQELHGDAARRVRARNHAQPLVPPSRPAARLPAAARRAGAVGLRPDRGREERIRGG